MLRNGRFLGAFLRYRALPQCTVTGSALPLCRFFSTGHQEKPNASGLSGWGGFLGLSSLLFFSSPGTADDEPASLGSPSGFSMLGMQMKQRMFFNYEKRIRELSTTEKVFEYFSSVERDGVLYMSPEDLLRSIVAVYPPEGSSVERAGSLPGERNPRLLHTHAGHSILKEIDCDGDGVISYPEYLLLMTLLSIPLKDVQTVVQVVDADGNGEIDVQEFQIILEALQNRVTRNSCGWRNFSYASAPGGMLHSFFGKDLDRRVNLEFLLSFLQRLQRDIVMLEFEYYDWQSSGVLAAVDFARSLITSAGPQHVCRLLDRVDTLPDALKRVNVTREDWEDVAQLREHLHVLGVAVRFFERLRGQVTQDDLARILDTVLHLKLRKEVLDIVGFVFSKSTQESHGALDINLMLTVLGRHCLTSESEHA